MTPADFDKIVVATVAAFALGYITRYLIGISKQAWKDAKDKAEARIKPLRFDG